MRPGLRPASDDEDATRRGRHPDAVAWRGEVVEANPAPVGDAVGEDLGDGARRLLAARRHDVPEKSGCAGAAPRIGHRREPRPALRARSVRLEVQEVRVEARPFGRRSRTPSLRARSTPRCSRARRSDHDRPALRAKIERERISRQPAGGSVTPPATTIFPPATPAPAAARGNGMRGSARQRPLRGRTRVRSGIPATV